MPAENIKLHDIVSWALWEKYGGSPVVGWMNDMSQVITPKELVGPERKEEKKNLNSSEALTEE